MKLKEIIIELITAIIIAALLYHLTSIQISSKFLNIKLFSLIIFFASLLSINIIWLIEIITRKEILKKIPFLRNPSYIFSLFVLIFGLSLLYAITIRDSKDLDKLINQEYIKVSDVISGKTTNSSSRGAKTRIKLTKYPDFNFAFKGSYISNQKSEEYNSNVKKGDSISIIIIKSEYLKKIEKKLPLTFWDKHLDYEDIRIYDLTINNIRYLRLEDLQTNAKNKRYGFGFWITLIISIPITLLGLILSVSLLNDLFPNKKPVANKRLLPLGLMMKIRKILLP